MPDLSMSTLNLVFAGLSVACALLSVVMFVLARRAARDDRVRRERSRALEAERAERAASDERRAAERRGADAKLPKGAEAALWAITETVPDPRNHVVLKDPTSEVKLHPGLLAAEAERQAALAEARADVDIAPEPEPAADDAAHLEADHAEDGPVLQERHMRSAIDETDVFTGEYFFAGEPRLNRF